MIILVLLKYFYREFCFLLFSSVVSERDLFIWIFLMEVLICILFFIFKYFSIIIEVNCEFFLLRLLRIFWEKLKLIINVLFFVFIENFIIV